MSCGLVLVGKEILLAWNCIGKTHKKRQRTLAYVYEVYTIGKRADQAYLLNLDFSYLFGGGLGRRKVDGEYANARWNFEANFFFVDLLGFILCFFLSSPSSWSVPRVLGISFSQGRSLVGFYCITVPPPPPVPPSRSSISDANICKLLSR